MTNPTARVWFVNTAARIIARLMPSVPPQRRAEVNAHANADTPMAWPEMRALPVNEAAPLLAGIDRMDAELERICEEAK